MPQIVKNLCEVRHDVRRIAAARYYVVDSSFMRHVFTHEVNHVIERLDSIESGTGLVWCAGRVRGEAVKSKLCRAIGKRATGARPVLVICMPVNRDIHIIKQALSDQIDFAAAAFLGRRAVQSKDTGRASLFEPVFYGDRRADGACAEKIVSAGLTRKLALYRAAGGDIVLINGMPATPASISNPSAASVSLIKVLLLTSW